MKKIAISLAVAMLGLCVALSTVGVASESDLGAQTYAWHLSADVMPVPPYGSLDILGSDTASKLIVNHPNGAVNATITGVMNGLNPDTTYTVYLSKPYKPYVSTGWSVSGTYMIDVEYLGVIYPENAVLTQSGTNINGTSLGGGPYPVFKIIGGSVDGNAITVVMTYGGLTTELKGTIAADGTMSGTWMDKIGGSRTGTWATTSGHATATHTGDMGWPGLYNPTNIPTFTFTTDDTGSGSWHVNIKAKDLMGPMASVWINYGGTLLISDSFYV